MARIPGVGQVRIFGAGPYSMRVWLDPQRLQTFGLTTADVLAAIQGQNVQVVAGQLGAPPVPPEQPVQLTINALGRLSDASQFEEIIVKTAAGTAPQIVRLRDIARVDLSQQAFTTFSRFTGHKSAQIAVFALPTANAIGVANQVYQAMAQMSRKFPEGMKYVIRYDTTVFVRQAIAGVYRTLLLAGVLVLIVILLFLQNFRAMLVPATTVPVTIIGAFIAIAALGFTINLMTLFALILAIGIVVDDAIVIVENSSYYIEKGLPPKDAAIKAMQELTGPVMGITLALVSVFLPAAFLPGITGQIFRQFALVIASTAVISAINALTLKPAQCALWLRPRGKKKPNWFYRGFNRAFRAVADVYVGAVAWMVRRPVLMLLVFALLISATFWEFWRRPTGFLPTEDQGYAILVTALPAGASQPRAQEVATQINALLEKTDGMAGWVVIGGLSILDSANLSNAVTTFVVYKDWKERGRALTQDRIVAHLNQELAGIQEALAFVVIPPPIRGLGQTGGLPDDGGRPQQPRLDRAAAGRRRSRPAGQLRARPAAPDHHLQRPQPPALPQHRPPQGPVSAGAPAGPLQHARGLSGFLLCQPIQQIQPGLPGLHSGGRPLSSPAPGHRQSLCPQSAGPDGPPERLARGQADRGPRAGHPLQPLPGGRHFRFRRTGVQLGTGPQPIWSSWRPKPCRRAWPTTGPPRATRRRRWVTRPTSSMLSRSFWSIWCLAALYESWASPGAVILVVPIALVGVLVALISRGYDIDLYTQVGLVLMIALASKNAILIVEFARDLHRDGQSICDAAVEATRRRFRPIVMTSFAFILGVTPLVVASGAGAASQQAIGTVVFGGMLASTLLAIPFVPVFYVLTARLGERRRKGGGNPQNQISR